MILVHVLQALLLVGILVDSVLLIIWWKELYGKKPEA
jgi:hypothetical protein